MLIYIAKQSFRCRKNIEMRPIRNRVRFLTKFQIESVLQKIAPYHMQKFGRCRKSSYLCTSNRRNSLSCQKAVIIEDRSWSKMMAGAGHQWRPKSRIRSPSQYTDVMTIEKFAKHITSHGSVYSRADISAILYMAVDCMREMLLEGKNLFGNNKQSRVVNSITRTK